jgi:hypothetical protein
MNDSRSTVRYPGYRSLRDGGRGFDFSRARGAASSTLITIDVSPTLFEGPNRTAIQEAAGIRYETLKCRLETEPACTSDRFDLTPSDVAQHRKITRAPGSILN